MNERDELDRFWAGKKVWRYAAGEGLLTFKILFSIPVVIGIPGWIFHTEIPFFRWASGFVIVGAALGLIFSVPIAFWARWNVWKNSKAVNQRCSKKS